MTTSLYNNPSIQLPGVLGQSLGILSTLCRVIVHSVYRVDPLQAETSEGRLCVIMGNGPSLTKDVRENLEFLKKVDCIGVNNFSLSPMYEVLKPKHYVICDPGYAERNSRRELYQSFQESASKLAEKTSWGLTIHAPKFMEKWNHFSESCGALDNIRFVYYPVITAKGPLWFRYAVYRRNLAHPPFFNVLNAAVFLAINLGYNPVFLVGADHSWLNGLRVDRQNRLSWVDDHFEYGATSPVPVYKNTFSRSGCTISETLEKLANAFSVYWELRAYAEARNTFVYNADAESYIDAFEKKSLPRYG